MAVFFVPNILRTIGDALLSAAQRLRAVRRNAWRALKQFKAEQNALLAGELVPVKATPAATKPAAAAKPPAASSAINNNVVRMPAEEKGAKEYERKREQLMVKPSGLAVTYRNQLKEKMGEEPAAHRRVATALSNLDGGVKSPGQARSRVSLEVHPSTIRGPVIEPDPRWKAMCDSSSLKCR